MTLTTEVRILWPVPAIALLDHVTVIAGGDPATVRRWSEDNSVGNRAAQGLMTLACVEWSEAPMTGDEPDPDWPDEEPPAPRPPALVILSIDNPYGGSSSETGRSVQANTILPAVAEWLDWKGVPRTAWWWEDETAGSFHPGTEDVRKLDHPGPRETWQPSPLTATEGASA